MSYYQPDTLDLGLVSFSTHRHDEANGAVPCAPNAYPTVGSSLVDYDLSHKDQTAPDYNSLVDANAMQYSHPLGFGNSSAEESLGATMQSMFGDSHAPETQHGMYAGDFGRPFDFYSSNPLDAPPEFYVDSFTAFGLPESPFSLSPCSSTQSNSPVRSPVDEHAPNAQLLVPQPSLAGPTSCMSIVDQSMHTGIEYSFALKNIGGGALMLGQYPPADLNAPPLHGVTAADEVCPSVISATSPSGAKVEVPSPAVPSPSSLPSAPAPRKRAPRGRKTRSSTSTKYTKASSPTSTVPCTVPGCQVRCFDEKTRDRHILTHNRNAAMNYYCPGMHVPRDTKLFKKCCCKKRTGYTREDALLRHLRDVEHDNPCAVEARKLGWDINVHASVQKLRGTIPQPQGMK